MSRTPSCGLQAVGNVHAGCEARLMSARDIEIGLVMQRRNISHAVSCACFARPNTSNSHTCWQAGSQADCWDLLGSGGGGQRAGGLHLDAHGWWLGSCSSLLIQLAGNLLECEARQSAAPVMYLARFRRSGAREAGGRARTTAVGLGEQRAHRQWPNGSWMPDRGSGGAS